MLLISLVSLVVLSVMMPFFTGVIDISVIPQLVADEMRYFIHGNDAFEEPEPEPVVEDHLLKDLETFSYDNKEIAKEKITEVYSHLPATIKEYLEKGFVYWQSHSSYKTYKSHEPLINNLLLIFAMLIIVKIAVSTFRAIFKKEEVKPIVKSQYVDFETMPICTGKAEIEEELMIQSYRELKESVILQELSKKTSETASRGFPFMNGSDDILDGSTPRQSTPKSLGSPLIIKSKNEPMKDFLTSSDGSSSISSPRSLTPEDSFEREERVLDKGLSKLNEVPSERPYTPSKLSISSSVEYSPSKRLIYKNSMSILTAHQIPIAETTVGEITEEVVYSEPFSSDNSEILTPLKGL